MRTEYYRLVEQFKQQVKEKQEVVNQLTSENTQRMREMLELRNRILDFEKKNEKITNESVKHMESVVNELKHEANIKMREGQVAVTEVKEGIKSMELYEKKAIIYEFKLLEWQNNCQLLQDRITQAKYENQIELAKMKQEIEAEYEEQLEKFK